MPGKEPFMQGFFFSDGTNLLRVLFTTVGGYIGVILILRISGPRTLSKMNSFDFVVTIALGSILAAGILQKSVALFDMLFAFALLVGLQFSATWLASRSSKINHMLKSEPILLFAEGAFLENAMKKSHVTKDEAHAAVRAQGLKDLAQVKFIVIESNGKVVAVKKD